MSYRLPGEAAPTGSTLITVTQAAFKRWMGKEMGYEAMPADNPGQECYYIHKQSGTVDGQPQVLNCHITAMLVHRSGGDCKNFHFKIQMGKASSHYWHYMLYQNPAGKFIWGADIGINGTNQAGGGAGDSLDAVRLNLLDVEKDCLKYGYQVEKNMNNGTLKAMLTKLTQALGDGRFFLNGTRLE